MSGEVKRLYRSRTDRWFAGICGGLGRYLNVDATLVRVLFVLFALAVGGGILAYLILWLIIPLEPEPTGSITELPVETDEEKTGP